MTSADPLAGLKDFQRASVEHAFQRLYGDPSSSRRFLIADETGLGKTMVARGLIQKVIDHLQHDDGIRRIDIVYVCSNSDIADQNLRKLATSKDQQVAPATRLSMLVSQPRLLQSSATGGTKPVTLVAFTPGTSFNMGEQSGQASERAILVRLLEEHLGYRRGDSTALRRILQGGVGTLERFNGYVAAQPGNWEPSIRAQFLRDFDASPAAEELPTLVAEVRGRSDLTKEQRHAATALTGRLRHLLARAGVRALEPDLIILDEFQRFRNLLDPLDPSAELAHHLFSQDDARVLLLSATPYKPFTLAEEAASGEDHYTDLFKTLEFLDHRRGLVAEIRRDLAAFRDATLAGRATDDLRAVLRTSLLRLMSRVERRDLSTGVTHTQSGPVTAADLAGYVALQRLASALESPLTVDYWKSAPYFVNFLDGYKVGRELKAALAADDRHHDLVPLIKASQRLHRRSIERFEPIDWGNSRLRQLAADTIDQGWWRLLWTPPSLPYYRPAGPFADPLVQNITKRIVFSSWVAAPSAIASLMSYEAERRIRTESGDFDRDRFTARLQYRTRDGEPASMMTLALFWPSPSLAGITDPLELARQSQTFDTDSDDMMLRAEARVQQRFGTDGTGTSSASTAWYWGAPFDLDGRSSIRDALGGRPYAQMRDALLGSLESGEALLEDAKDGITLHAGLAFDRMNGLSDTANVERPTDFVSTLALLGVAAPGNVAWRSLRRLLPDSHSVTEIGLWDAAAVIASGFRTLFNRPDATYLLSTLGASDEETYWRAVLQYCRSGNVQAMLDEYLHHLVGSEGLELTDDQQMLRLAHTARRALVVRGATYQATDVDHPDRAPISFFGRFALRYGGLKQQQDDARLPEVRAAFNSPFWPFVLATTSIGQEGVDFHWWCHSIVHWNLPANPVDFEQREGRVNRFHGHAIRKNLVHHFQTHALVTDTADLWSTMYAAAEAARAPGVNDMVPHWDLDGPAATERHVLSYPMSRDEEAWANLKKVIALYRLAFGQPRQDLMIELLAQGSQLPAMLDLSPPMVLSGGGE
ncbi:MAG: hypothetical protein RL238_725 [Actinomycetota bacterium]|jgi:hypothetical protein